MVELPRAGLVIDQRALSGRREGVMGVVLHVYFKIVSVTSVNQKKWPCAAAGPPSLMIRARLFLWIASRTASRSSTISPRLFSLASCSLRTWREHAMQVPHEHRQPGSRSARSCSSSSSP